MTAVLRVLMTIALSLALTPASAQRATPTDIELRTAYCIPVLQQAVQDSALLAQAYPDGQWKDWSAEAAAGLNDKLKRLQAYLEPKIGTFDQPTLTVAAERGKLDVDVAAQAQLSCFKQCESSKPAQGLDDRYTKCLSSCQAANPVVARTRACHRLDWLPF
ncbi:hypothetical protein [Variovorax saccharolyticus]|uniref:hypothetical protein n=1 Tax=Variovorax saccharolyticus TaxID=3053516 RepID=UPI0025750DEE|nr:hypothetical protein [Variovorax sp. J31P216]MDM0029645.1 hypothetical protein [Variovorax sp. J31P216]